MDALKARRDGLARREAEVDAAVRALLSEREEIANEMARVTSDINLLANAPASDGVDHSARLPDELLELILASSASLWSDAFDHVCRRWRRIARMCRQRLHKMSEKRWSQYERLGLRPFTYTSPVDINNVHATDSKMYVTNGADVDIFSLADFSRLSTLTGHTRNVYAIAEGFDGAIYTVSRDKTVKVWSKTGACVRTLEGHTSPVLSLCVDHDGKVYSGSNDNSIREWSPDGQHVRTLTGHTDGVIVLVVGPNGKVYSGSYDRTVRVWDDNGDWRTIISHSGYVYALAVAPDGTVYSGGGDSAVRAWIDVTSEIVIVCKNVVMDVAVGKDNMLYVAAGRSLLRYSRKDYTLVNEVSHHTDVYSMCIGPDGKVYVTAEKVLYVW